MRHVETVQTMLDLTSAPPAIACPICSPGPKGDICESCWVDIFARHAALLALPAVVAVIDRLPILTDVEWQKLATAWLANFGIHRGDQTKLRHRVSRALGEVGRKDVLSATEQVWHAADGVAAGRHWAVACAAQDVAYVAMVGDLLSDDEARLFTKPWTDALGST